MIGYLKGKVILLEEQRVLVEAGGVGYEVLVGPTDGRTLAPEGGVLELWIYTYAREDQLTLFGFEDAARKKIFTILIGVSGIGPKLAMAIIVELTPTELFDAVLLGHIKTLTSISGVGKKTAERMIVELKDKLSVLQRDPTMVVEAGSPAGSLWRDLSDALSGLGFPDAKVRNVINLLRKEPGVEGNELNILLKLALQKIKNC